MPVCLRTCYQSNKLDFFTGSVSLYRRCVCLVKHSDGIKPEGGFTTSSWHTKERGLKGGTVMVSNLREVLLYLHDTPRKGDWKEHSDGFKPWGDFMTSSWCTKEGGLKGNSDGIKLREVLWHLHDTQRKVDWKGHSDGIKPGGDFTTSSWCTKERGLKGNSDGIKLIKEIPLGHHDTKRRRTDRNVQSKMI